MASRDAFSGLTFAAFFSTKKIPVVAAVMISPSLIEYAFYPVKTTNLCIAFCDNCMVFLTCSLPCL